MINSTLFHEGTDAPSSDAGSSAAPQKRRPGRPRIHPPKEKLTREELSLVRAEAGRKGGLVRSQNKIPSRTVRMWTDDFKTVRRVMQAKGLSCPLAMHLIIEFFREKVSL